eukprot:TRINITY_DN9502_c0_g1_i1.p1 TRINITY_DN9502_c0_g1~~TRINITY_DN9502_c0_g1_i1.p1  ORF type:complete len:313 (-),score=70.82 TRINITY_DN9502_c0_g1_i1:30-968(-)
MSRFDDLVLSDVHVETTPNLCAQDGTHLLRLVVSSRRGDQDSIIESHTQELEVDEDGDPILTRTHSTVETIDIEHQMATPLKDVGLQVWKGALVLSDYLVELGRKLDEFVVLDLGCGTGVTSIVAARHAKVVFATDYDLPILQLAEKNASRNRRLYRDENSIRVRRLDFYKGLQSADSHQDQYAWKKKDFDILESSKILVVAADVVYDNEITDALMDFLRDISGKYDVKCLFGLERRYNFTLDDLNISSPAYDRFREHIQESGQADQDSEIPPENRFDGMQISTDFGSHLEYARTPELEIWELSVKKSALHK